MRINIKTLLEYFDLKQSTNYGDTTAAIPVVGEDLCAAIFKHFCELQLGSKVDIIDSNQFIPVQMKRIGRRLDRWIIENRKGKFTLYQTEIKNWCSRAIGGVDIPIEVNEKTLNNLAEINWNHHIPAMTSKDGNSLNKVLVEMLNDRRLNLNVSYKKEPLLILWHAGRPKGEKKYFFKYLVPKKYFYYEYCWVFSCSLYLRHLYTEGHTEIIVDMPNVTRRLKQLNQIFVTTHL